MTVLFVVCFLPSLSWAQQTEADRLFEEGRELLAQRKFAEACSKFEASHEAEASVGALLNLAKCRELNQQPATAVEVYRRAQAMAREADDEQRAAYAEEQIAALAPQLSFLVIEVTESARHGAPTVRRGDVIVDPAQWGQPIAVDPGQHVITAQVPDAEPFEVTVTVAGAGSTERVTVPEFEVAVSEPESPVVPVTPAGVDDVERGEGTPMPLGRKLALGSGAVGAAGVIVGVVFGLRARGRYRDAEDLCTVDEYMTCAIADYDASQALRSDARGDANLATASLIVGVVGLGAGVALWFMNAPEQSPAPTETASGVRIEPVIGQQWNGVQASWRF
ncbi:hypothetical protein [Haliangium sp.]|uniref:hypothetical protein n=1 Tax=Haliangium sp. TaxID=2663208 RepID=UPI003D120CA7